jgi:hypothetical protein
MDRYAACRILESVADAGIATFEHVRAGGTNTVEGVRADGASLIVETTDGERFVLEVTREGRVGDP